jgi:hypothetical protein
MSVDLGGDLGKMFVTGTVSALGLWQDTVFPGDHSERIDLSNAQIFLQKTDGLIQFYVQAGAYSIPDLGVPYVTMNRAEHLLWGYVPVGFLKIAPSDAFSIQVGELPTLIGAEYSFTFENLNIERGLLWNQEPAISRGIQVNYTAGPLAVSASWNDGLYSGRYNWLSALATWTIDTANVLAVDAGGNLGHTGTNTYATTIAQNNEAIFNIMYTHTEGPWTLNPYFQYTSVGSNKALGFGQDADSVGLALLVNYAFDADSPLGGFSLPARVEYITTSGSLSGGAPNLLYGPGSDAWSFTITPTFQKDLFFARAELSFVSASSTTRGDALGPAFNSTSQTRIMLETGFAF